MKNFKKILSGVLVASAMASCLALPTYADVVYDDLSTYTEYDLVRFELPDSFDIQTVLDDEDQTLVLNGRKFKLKETIATDFSDDPFFAKDSADYSYNFSEEGNEKSYFTYVVNVTPDDKKSDGILYEVAYAISPQPDDVTVGDSTTVGESEPTGVRGDINYDGKVTTVDLLLLKKYLLGIVKW